MIIVSNESVKADLQSNFFLFEHITLSKKKWSSQTSLSVYFSPEVVLYQDILDLLIIRSIIETPSAINYYRKG